MMDVDRLEATRPQILELVRDTRRAENDLARRCVERPIPDVKSCTAFYNDKGLVIGVHVEAWPNTYFISPVRKNRRGPP